MNKRRKRWEWAYLMGIWGHMLKRCSEPTYKKYQDYGGRGIRVCERWRDFKNFRADMGHRPSPAHTLDRINNDGNYEPGNCRWATWEEQNRNRRYARVIEFNGESMCLKDWATKLGIRYTTLHERIQRGWPVEQAFTIPSSFANTGLRLRRVGVGRRRPPKIREQTHCDKGHELPPDGYRVTSSGKAICKTCDRIRGRIADGWPRELAESMPTVKHGYDRNGRAGRAKRIAA